MDTPLTAYPRSKGSAQHLARIGTKQVDRRMQCCSARWSGNDWRMNGMATAISQGGPSHATFPTAGSSASACACHASIELGGTSGPIAIVIQCRCSLCEMRGAKLNLWSETANQVSAVCQ